MPSLLNHISVCQSQIMLHPYIIYSVSRIWHDVRVRDIARIVTILLFSRTCHNPYPLLRYDYSRGALIRNVRANTYAVPCQRSRMASCQISALASDIDWRVNIIRARRFHQPHITNLITIGHLSTKKLLFYVTCHNNSFSCVHCKNYTV